MITDTKKLIGKTVEVVIDRPIGSKHPKFDNIYPINYGYIPNTKAGDGKEVDAYILGVDKPLNKFTGRCIAIIVRFDDNEDKLVVVSDGDNYSDKEITQKTNFQEKYFKSKIIR